MNWKKRLINTAIIAAIFFVSVNVFSFFTNKGNENLIADMGAATLPQISFPYNGYALNTVPGYVNEMDIPLVRDTITPVSNSQLQLHIKAYENVIDSVDYEVYTLDGKDKIMSNSINAPGEQEMLSLSGASVLDEERVLKVTLHTEGGRDVYYYTRIMDAMDTGVLNCLDFVSDFHESALKKDDSAGIRKSLETLITTSNSNFSHVTIHNDYNHVTWGSLKPRVEGGERWSIKEMNDVYTCVQIEYDVRCDGEENEADLYKVREFFRVRYRTDTKKTVLLDYDRVAEQIFDPTKNILTEKKLLLGVAKSDVQYLVNKKGTIVAFVQGDELWNFNSNNGELSLVFTFSSVENTDPRNFTDQHAINLLGNDSKGNLIFGVAGYMNRGQHEGEVGIGIYYYNCSENSVEEKAFISTNQSYANTIEEFGQLLYYNMDKDLVYVLADGRLYEINIKRATKKAVTDSLIPGQYVASDNNRLVAYQTSENLAEARELKVLNLKTGEDRTIRCRGKECILPLGFMNTDLIYGVAKKDDIGRTPTGEQAIPMFRIQIQNTKGELLKTYEPNGLYVLSIEIDRNMITLHRATRNKELYQPTADDYITNNEAPKDSNIALETYMTDLKKYQTRFGFKQVIKGRDVKPLSPKQIMGSAPLEFSFEFEKAHPKYYVYGYGQMQGSYATVGEAIRKAVEYDGVVVSSEQEYLWEKGNRKLTHNVQGKDSEIAKLEKLLKSGKTAAEAIGEVTDSNTLDLSGCLTEQVLYLLSHDRPVIAMETAKTPLILIGYTEGSVTYIEAKTGEKKTVRQKELDNQMEDGGRLFIGY